VSADGRFVAFNVDRDEPLRGRRRLRRRTIRAAHERDPVSDVRAGVTTLASGSLAEAGLATAIGGSARAKVGCGPKVDPGAKMRVLLSTVES
jgi:hypothetical protein